MSVVLEFLGTGLAAASVAYLVLALRATARFRERPHRVLAQYPPATVLIPAYGAPRGLEDCLRSICAQDYPEFQIVFGLHRPDDPARSIIERIIASNPGRDMTLVIDGRMIGANPKNCNLANMYPAAKHDIIVMVDSDIKVGSDFLATIVAELDQPDVGGVTCMYKASSTGTLASDLGALAINDWFIPSVLVDVSRREMDICYGAAIAVRRGVLTDIGGFEAMASAVAQDFVFGQELRRLGYRVRLAPYVVETVVGESTFRALFRHELRWNRAVRACRPRDHALSVVTHALPLVAALRVAGGFSWADAAIVGSIVGLRLALHYLVRARIEIPASARPWLDPVLVPARECLSFFVWLAAFATRRVRWGERRLKVQTGLSMTVDRA